MISYPWATGARVPRVRRSAASAWRAAAARAVAGPGCESRRDRGARNGDERRIAAQLEGIQLEAMVAKAADADARLEDDQRRVAVGNAPRVVLTLDSGDGGQPQKRATLTLDRAHR